MKKPVQILSSQRVLAVVLITLAAQLYATSTWAASGNVQICRPNTTCEVGEFLYNDDYGVINDATCKFNSRYPDGNTFIDNETMPTPSDSDGWYKYDVQAPATTGVYRSTICCETGGDKLCLDKSFEVQESATVAAAAAGTTLTKEDVADSVWNARLANYNRPGSFGALLAGISPTIAKDIAKETWNYSDRSLSSFGNIITQIFNEGGIESVTKNGSTTIVKDGSLTGTGVVGVIGLVLLAILLVGTTVAFYLRHKHLEEQAIEDAAKLAKSKKGKKAKKEEVVEMPEEKAPFNWLRHPIGFSVVILTVGLGVGIASGVMVGKYMFTSQDSQKVIAKSAEQEVLSELVDAQNAKIEEEASKSAKLIRVEVPEDSSINVRDLPDKKGIVLTKVDVTTEFEKSGEEDDWFKIVLDSVEDSAFNAGWVSKDFAVEVEEDGSTRSAASSTGGQAGQAKDVKTLTIKETPTGYLRVRTKAWGEEIDRVDAGEEFEYIKQENGWTQILLKDGTGWVYSQYVSN